MTLQDYISEIISAGYTQTEIAAIVGLTQPTISAMSRGEVKRTFALDAIRSLHKSATRRLKQKIT